VSAQTPSKINGSHPRFEILTIFLEDGLTEFPGKLFLALLVDDCKDLSENPFLNTVFLDIDLCQQVRFDI
jgi:hypothetical protein